MVNIFYWLLVSTEPTIDETVESKPCSSLHQELKEQLDLTSETELEPGTREVLSDDLGNLVSHRPQSLRESFSKVEAFLHKETENKNLAQELDMKALPMNWIEDDILYTKVSVSALCSQGVSKQRSHSKYATEATPPRIVSVSSKLASIVRTSKQELEQKERIDAATVDKKVEENATENCQRQKSFEITDSKSQFANNKASLQDPQVMTDERPVPASSVNSPKVKRETKQPSKRKSFLDDQLNDFLFLTGVTSGYEKSFKKVKNEWKNDKDRDETKDQEQNTKHDIANQADTTPSKEEVKPFVAEEKEIIQGDEPQVKKKKKNKSKTVIIKIPGELFKHIV
ncbi:hypothetical protein HOLleu_15272 [Holothuria leucospilota]|uniref:Uncharacterized protein n=1 Tax=Holothuria leucospilota TaxID=206669 RepID=A0A9Q1C9W1_HOLLE|nr:hypothetical protein HOLleu_15272 [Holothuria leucospilota]